MTDSTESAPGAPPRVDASSKKVRFEPGDLIANRYRVVSAWGTGRLDEAYEVEDLERRELVVLKVLRRTSGINQPKRGIQRAFDRLNRLSHRNVARVHDLSTYVIREPGRVDETVLFVTSELLEGETLGSFIRRTGTIDPSIAASLIDSICSGLTAAHRRRIVHGDLSSAAIILCGEGDDLRPVITDFSLHAVDEPYQTAIIGSPAFKAPEMIVGRLPSAMSDVFSLGVVIYELLSGKIPFTGGNLLALDFRRLEEDPRPLRELARDIDPWVERVVLRCLSRIPDDRYAHAGEVKKALSGKDLWTPRTRRNVGTLSAAAALVFVMLGGSALLDRLSILEQNRLAGLVATEYRPSIAVLDLAPSGPSTEPWMAKALSELIRSDLAETPTVRVAEASLVRELCGIIAPETGGLDPDLSRRIKILFDVEAVIIGTCSIDEGGDVPAVVLDICVVDTRSGETIAAAFERGSPDSLPELAIRATARLRSSIGLADAEDNRSRWDPDAVRPWAEGLLYLDRHRVREAVESLRNAVAIQSDNALIHDALGLAWHRVGYARNAADEARSAIELTSPRLSEIDLYRRATLAALEGNHLESIEMTTELIRLFPDRNTHTYRLIEELTETGRFGLAAEEIRRVRAIDSTVDPRIELAAARLSTQTGDLEQARFHADRAAEIASLIGSSALEGEAMLEGARASAAMNESKKAWADLARAESLLLRTDAVSGLARIDSMRAVILQREGELEASLEAHRRQQERYRASGQEQGYASTLGSMAMIRSLQGQHRESLVFLEEAVARFRSIDDDINVVRSLSVIGNTYLALGRLDEAFVAFQSAAGSAQDNDLPVWAALSRTGLARVAIARLDLASAERNIEDARSIFDRLGLGEETAGTDIVASELDRLRGDLPGARERLSRAESTPATRSDLERLTEVRLALGVIAESEGRHEAALALALAADSFYASVGNVDRRAEALAVALRAAISLGHEDAVKTSADLLDAISSDLQSPALLMTVRLARAQTLDPAPTMEALLNLYRDATTAGLPLVQLETAAVLARVAEEPAVRKKWLAEVQRRADESGARLFLKLAISEHP